MEARYYLTCLWPGLAELWWRGRLSAVPTAMVFAFAFNSLLITRYLYPEWMASGLVTMAFWVGLVVWSFYVIRSIRELPQLITPRKASEEPDRFDEAHAAFLAADWEEAEQRLTHVLAIEPRDPPALLLLVGTYRHSGRLDEAQLLLAEVGRLEVSDHWWLEVAAENQRLERAKEIRDEAEEGESSAADPPDADKPVVQADKPVDQVDEPDPTDKPDSTDEPDPVDAADLTEPPRMAA